MADVIVQQPIRSVYKDGSVVVSNVKSKIDNSTTSYSVVTTWYDGSAMDDSKVDQWGIYSKYKATGEYLRENKPQWGELFLEVDTVAELRAMSAYNQFLIKIGYYKGVTLNGYYVKGDTPRSLNYYISETISLDDGGSVFLVGTLRLEHKFDDAIDVRYFGAKALGSFDNSTVFENVVACLVASNSFRPVFYVPIGFTAFYYIRPLTIPSNIHVFLGSVLSFSGGNATGLTIGTPGVVSSVDVYIRFQRTTQSTWENYSDVGVRLINLYRSTRSTIQSIQGFTIGLVCEGISNAFAYSKIFLGTLSNNKLDIWITSSNSGLCNQNEFFGGNFNRASAINNNKDIYGIRISSRDGTYVNLNSNKFYSPSFEYRGDVFTDMTKEIIPIEIIDGQNNKFESVRSEFNDYGLNANIFIRTSGAAQRNEVQFIYSQNVPTNLRIQDLGIYPSTVCYSQDFHIANEINTQKCVVNIADIRSSVLETISSNARSLTSELNFASSSNFAPAADQVTLFPDSVQLPSTRGFAVRIDTRNNKRFAARVTTHIDSITGCRYNVRCYDANGNKLDNTVKDHVFGTANRSPIFNQNFGGVWRTGADSNTGFYFVVSDETVFIDLVISGGSGSTRFTGISIYCQDGIANVLKTTSFVGAYSTVKPVDITKPIGTFVSDASDNVIGWKYTSSGWIDVPKISSTNGVWNISTGAILTAATASYTKIDKQVALSGQLSFATADTDVTITLPFAPDYGGIYIVGNLTFTLSNTTTATVRSSVVGNNKPFQLNFKTA